MTNTKTVLDVILNEMKKNPSFRDVTSKEIKGFNFSAADITFPDKDGNTDFYRVVVIKYS